MSISRIKKNDVVVVITGVDSGKTGKVLDVDNERGRAVVEGLNLKKKTVKRSQENPQGGIVKIPAPIALSNLMPYDPEAKKGVRIRRVQDGDKTVRKSVATGHTFE